MRFIGSPLSSFAPHDDSYDGYDDRNNDDGTGN